MSLKVIDVHSIRIESEQADYFEVSQEAWSTALILVTVLNGTDGRYADSRIACGSGSIRISFIKALRAAFKLNLKEAKLLMDAAQEQYMANRLEASLEDNSEGDTS